MSEVGYPITQVLTEKEAGIQAQGVYLPRAT